jgi:hypothetical protein
MNEDEAADPGDDTSGAFIPARTILGADRRVLLFSCDQSTASPISPLGAPVPGSWVGALRSWAAAGQRGENACAVLRIDSCNQN